MIARLTALLLGLLLGGGYASAAATEPSADASATDSAAVFAHPLSASDLAKLLGPATQGLATAAGIRGRFEQRRFLRELPRPLLSTGDFVFARDIGVHWHTVKPFDAVFILTRDGAVSRDTSGTETRIASADQPGVAVAARIFFALFALDFETLSQDFELYGQTQGTHWQVGLRPKLAAMSAVFKESLIVGDHYARQITLSDARGDRTEIELPTTMTLVAPLTPSDRALFTQ